MKRAIPLRLRSGRKAVRRTGHRPRSGSRQARRRPSSGKRLCGPWAIDIWFPWHNLTGSILNGDSGASISCPCCPPSGSSVFQFLIKKGLAELGEREEYPDRPLPVRLRREGGGRKRSSEADPELLAAL